MSECYHEFGTLIEHFENATNTPTLLENERCYVIKCIKSRWEFIYNPCHALAYLLDFRYLGEKLDADRRATCVQSIMEFPLNGEVPNTESEQAEILNEFNSFMRTAWQIKQSNGIAYKQYAEGRRSNLDYWLTEGGHLYKKIKPLATRLFSLTASTGGVERSNSTMGFIHSKLRNSLGEAKVSKIVYIKENHSCLDIKNNVVTLHIEEEEEHLAGSSSISDTFVDEEEES